MDEQTFDRIMLEAIAEEIAARDFYREAATRVGDASVKVIFAELARDEEEHRATLETFRFDPTARVEFARVEDYQVSEAQRTPALSFDLTPKEAFQLAMKKEQRSLEVYTALARVATRPETRKLYEQLAEMERGHKARLEDLFTGAAYPEAW